MLDASHNCGSMQQAEQQTLAELASRKQRKSGLRPARCEMKRQRCWDSRSHAASLSDKHRNTHTER